MSSTYKGHVDRTIQAHFGICVAAMTIVWELVAETAIRIGIRLIHLLWTLYFLKVFPTKDIGANFFGVAREIYRKWVWKVIGLLYQHLDVVRINGLLL